MPHAILPTPATSACLTYDREETEVLQAVEAYRRDSGRRFVSPREVIHVMKALGYERVNNT